VNHQEVGRLVSLLADAYPHVSVRKGTVEAYSLALIDLPWNEARAAVLEHLGTSRFWPSIAEIRELVARRRTGLPDAETAWATVAQAAEAANREIAERGSYYRVPFACELIERAVGVIGWERIRSGEDRSILSAQFRRLFESWRHAIDRAVALGEDPAEALDRLPNGTHTFAEIAGGLGIFTAPSLREPSGAGSGALLPGRAAETP
jgi:hypothetical protein